MAKKKEPIEIHYPFDEAEISLRRIAGALERIAELQAMTNAIHMQTLEVSKRMAKIMESGA